MTSTNTNTLANRILSTLKVTDITINALVEKMGTNKSAVYNAVCALRDTYNIVTLNRSTYHLEDGPSVSKKAVIKITEPTKAEFLLEVLAMSPGEYVPTDDIIEYTGFTDKQLDNNMYRVRKTYTVEYSRRLGYKLVGKKSEITTVFKPIVIQPAFSQPLTPIVKETPKEVLSPVNRLRHLVLGMRELDVEQVSDFLNVDEREANRFMVEAGDKYKDELTHIQELTPNKDIRHIGGFVSKDSMTSLEIRTWHLTMALGKCRRDDISINLGISSNEAMYIMNSVAKKCSATISYDGYIKAN